MELDAVTNSVLNAIKAEAEAEAEADDLCEFEASLVCRMSSRTAKAT